MNLRNGYRALFIAYSLLFPWLAFKCWQGGDYAFVVLCVGLTVSALRMTYLSIFKPRF